MASSGAVKLYLCGRKVVCNSKRCLFIKNSLSKGDTNKQ